MKESEAAKVLTLLQAGYPGHEELPEATVRVWSAELASFNFEDAWEAARLMSRLNKFFPSLAELIEGTTEERNTRVLRERGLEHRNALPAETEGSFISFSDWLATQDEEMVARAKRVIPTATRNALDRAEMATRQQPLPS